MMPNRGTSLTGTVFDPLSWMSPLDRPKKSALEMQMGASEETNTATLFIIMPNHSTRRYSRELFSYSASSPIEYTL